MASQGGLRILAILNGSVRGYSGGDLHTVEILNVWSRQHQVELLLPRGSSMDIAPLVSFPLRAPRGGTSGSSRSRLRYALLLAFRMVSATTFVLARPDQWDVVIASSHYAFDAVPALLARGSALRVLYWWHHATAPQGRPKWVQWLINISERLTARLSAIRCAAVFTGNSETKAWLISKHLDASRIALTRNAPSVQARLVPDDEALDGSPMLGKLRPSDGIVLFFARLSNLKGARDLPAICEYVLHENPDAVVVICGPDGNESDGVRRALRSLELAGGVMFLGFVSEAVKRWLFDRSHVVVAPSYEEGWGGTVADAVASGCWVVAYDLAAVRESSPRGPVLVPLGDVESFARATAECLKKPRPSKPPQPPDLWSEIADEDLKFILTKRQTRQHESSNQVQQSRPKSF